MATSKGYLWFTSSNGSYYKAKEKREPEDRQGRIGFKPADNSVIWASRESIPWNKWYRELKEGKARIENGNRFILTANGWKPVVVGR